MPSLYHKAGGLSNAQQAHLATDIHPIGDRWCFAYNDAGEPLCFQGEL